MAIYGYEDIHSFEKLFLIESLLPLFRHGFDLSLESGLNILYTSQLLHRPHAALKIKGAVTEDCQMICYPI